MGPQGGQATGAASGSCPWVSEWDSFLVMNKSHPAILILSGAAPASPPVGKRKRKTREAASLGSAGKSLGGGGGGRGRGRGSGRGSLGGGGAGR